MSSLYGIKAIDPGSDPHAFGVSSARAADEPLLDVWNDASGTDVAFRVAVRSGGGGKVAVGRWEATPVAYQYGGTGLSALGSAYQVLRTNAAANAVEWGAGSGAGQGVYRATTQTLTADSSYQTIIFPTTDWGSGYFDASTGIITLGTAGRYLIEFYVTHSGTTNNYRIRKTSGTAATVAEDNKSGRGYLARVVNAAAADTYALQLQDNGSGLVVSAGLAVTWASVTFLGTA